MGVREMPQPYTWARFAREYPLQFAVLRWLKRNRMLLFTGACLFLLLLYTWTHTGSFLADYIRPAIVGRLAAMGIEGIIVVVSWRIGVLLRVGWEKHKIPLAIQGGILAFVLLVSTFANISEGYRVKYGDKSGKPVSPEVAELTWGTSAQPGTLWGIDRLQVLLGALATGLIPVVVVAVAEILAGMSREDDALALSQSSHAPLAAPDPAPPTLKTDVVALPTEPAEPEAAPEEQEAVPLVCDFAAKRNRTGEQCTAMSACDYCGVPVCNKDKPHHVRYDCLKAPRRQDANGVLEPAGEVTA